MFTAQAASELLILLWILVGPMIFANAYLIAKKCRSFWSVCVHLIVFFGSVLGIIAFYSGQFLIDFDDIVIGVFVILVQFIALIAHSAPKKSNAI
jgi:hypothetical protein